MVLEPIEGRNQFTTVMSWANVAVSKMDNATEWSRNQFFKIALVFRKLVIFATTVPDQTKRRDAAYFKLRSPSNCILMENLLQASTLGTQTDKAPVYDSDGFNSEVSEQKDTTKGTSVNTQFSKQSILGKPPSSSKLKLYAITPFPKSKGLPKIDKTHALSKLVMSNSIPTPQESKVMNNDKKDVNSDSNGLSSTGVDNTAKTRRPQPRSNTKNDKVPSASNSICSKNKEVKVEEHPRNLLLSKNNKHMSSECNHVKLAIRNDKSEVVCAMCKQCLIIANHDVCVLNYVNDMNSRGKKQKANVSKTENQKKQKPKVIKPKKVGSNKRLASPKPSKPRSCLRWLPTGRLFDLKGKIIASSESESQSNYSNGDNACTSNPPKPTIKRFPNSISFLDRNLKLLINFVWKFLGTVRFGDDHVAAILGFGDLQWGNILITKVYFIEGLGHSLFLVGQFCDSNLEVAFRRNTCFVRNLEGVDLLKGNRTINLYTINLHEMASASLICLMACATSTMSWLWHQRLSHLNFDTINDLAKNNLVTGLLKFKYHIEHLCPSCEQRKSKRASHPPKPFLNSKQRLHLLHMDLCGPMRIASINEKRYVLVIIDHYSRYTWLLQLRATLKTVPSFTVDLTKHHTSSFTAKKPDISFLHVFGALCYPKNDREDIGKLGAKGDISFFIGYSADSFAYIVYNRRTKKIIEIMNVTFDELSSMDFEQSSSKPGLQSMTPRQISPGLNLTYAPSTITTQQPTEGELDLLFEAMYDDHIGGQPSSAPRTVLAAQAPKVLQTPMATTTTADTAPTPTNSSSQATNFPNTSQDIDEIETQQHVQHQPVTIADNVPNDMFD
ncbi:integrase, catalytic region, zinc finger, CCHC-type containing protein [Tanacetum coccineum]